MSQTHQHQASNRTSRGLSLALAVLMVAVCYVSLRPVTTGSVTHASTIPAAQDTPTPTPDEEKDRLQREADLATLRKTKAEADKAELEARFPKPSTSPLEGKTTVEGAVIESQMISYIALSRSADRIVDALKPRFKNGENLAVYNEQDVSRMLSYRVANEQVNELLTQGYCQILSPAATNNLCPVPTPSPVASPSPHGQGVPPAAVLPIAQSFLGAFVDMTALLRTNVEIKGQTFTVDEAPLVAEIFRAANGKPPLYCGRDDAACMTRKGFENPGDFYYPYVFPPEINRERGSEILKRLEDVHRVRGNALQLIDAIDKDSAHIDKGIADIKELKKTIGEDLPKQTATAVKLAGALIQANCRQLSHEVDAIKQLPAEAQSDPMINLINTVKEKCPRMNHDHLVQLLNLQNVLVDLGDGLKEAQSDLKTAGETKKQAEKDLDEQLKNLILNLKDPANTTERKASATAAIAQLKAVNAQFDNLVVSLIQPQAGGTNPLTDYIRTERLLYAVSSDNTKPYYWLVVKVINAGGNNRIKTNLVVDIFTGGNRISHSGGVIVDYHLFDSTGKSLESGTVSDYTDYIKANKVRAVTGSAR